MFELYDVVEPGVGPAHRDLLHRQQSGLVLALLNLPDDVVVLTARTDVLQPGVQYRQAGVQPVVHTGVQHHPVLCVGLGVELFEEVGQDVRLIPDQDGDEDGLSSGIDPQEQE